MADYDQYNDNIDENQYSEYLDDSSRPMTRFLKDQDDSGLLPWFGKQALHTGIAVGVMALAHRTGATKQVARFMETHGKGSLQALKETLHNRGQLGKVSNLDGIFKEFNERRISNVEQRKHDLEDFMVSRGRGIQNEYDMERHIRQMNHVINNEIPSTMIEQIRFDRMINELQNQHGLGPDHINEVYRALEQGAVQNGDLRFIRHLEDDSLRSLLRQHGVQNNDVVDAVVTARNHHKNTNIQAEAGIQELLQQRQEQMRQFVAENMDTIVKKRWDQGIRNTVAGHKLATVNDVLALHQNGQIQLDDDLRANLEDIIKRNQKFGDAIFDRNLYVRKNGRGEIKDFMDYKVFDQTKREAQNWMASTIPGGLAHMRDFLNIQEAREAAGITIINRGARFQSLNAQMGVDIQDTLHQEVMFVNGKFVNVYGDTAQPIEVLNKQRDMYLTSSRFGTIANSMRHIGGIMSEEKERNAFTKGLDLFNQDKDSRFALATSVFTKAFNPDWDYNIIRGALREGVDYDHYHDVRRYFEKYSKGLSARTLNHLVQEQSMPAHVKEFIQNNNINFSKEEDIMKLFRYFGEDETGKQYASNQMKALWKKYERNPDEFLASKKPVGESNLLIREYTHIQSGYDRINQSIGLEMIHQTQMYPHLHGSGIKFNFPEYVQNLEQTGQILKSDRQDAEFLYSHYQYQQTGASIYSARDATLNHINDLFTGNSSDAMEFQRNLLENVRRTNPWYEKFTGNQTLNRVGNEYIAVNKAWSGWHGMDTIKDYWKQLSLTTGRRNMEDVTTASIFGSYYPFYRLQDALGDLKLGFSDDSLSSPLKIMSSLFLKRMLPVYGAYQAYQYADYRIDQDTGMGLTERYQNSIARGDLDEALKRDATGATDRKKRDFMLHPGIDQWGDMPEINLGGIRHLGPSLLFRWLSPGTPIDEKDTYNAEEMQDYYENGVDPQRKSKWWFMGSKTAFRGDRVTEFRPNALRMAQSDWEYSSVTQSGHDRWENSWFPTFENWFGLKRLTGQIDPYAWERQHYYDRPYLLTGSMFNPNTMWLGDIGNATVGQLLKPVRPMHMEDWGDPVLITEENKELGHRPTRPITTRVSPAARMENVVKAGPVDYGADVSSVQYVNGDQVSTSESSADLAWMGRVEGAKIKYVKRPELDQDGNKTGAYVATDLDTNETIYVPVSQAERPTGELFAAARELADDRENTKPRGMFAQEYPYQEVKENERLQNLKDPRSLEWRSQEAFENFREMLGAYNWIVGDELVKYDPYRNKTRIQAADNATNASNQFWGMNIGSLGGEMSEIGRRFIRRDSGQLEDYNPVKNTMPDWMPGGDYFINFQTGDPYSKIEHGEYRLPGEAYEKLNQLHPDSTGDYGAFDKFKILADVAPWSDEYRFWRDYFVHHNDDPELRKQGAEIKRQVAQRKKKFDFYDYQFKYADVEKHDVTITKFLDDYTFLTKEYGDTPIRMAGVSYRSKADGVMAQYFKPGDKVTVGIDADQSKQVSSDTYGTMRAVVYKKQFNINQDIIRRGLMKENETDFSAPSVQARFSPAEIAEGSRWESIAHLESPLNTKFLQVRSSLEEYERDQVFGKDWATWDRFLTKDYLIPTFQQAFRHDFFQSVMEGGIAGAVVGGVFMGGGRNRTLGGAIIGSVIGGMGNMYRHVYEAKTGEAWIPERRRKENDVNEYFDILKYMKFTGLYEEAKREAADQGYDVEAVEEQIDLKKQEHDETVKSLEAERRQLYLDQPKGWEDRRKEINKQLNDMTEDGWDELSLPEPVLQALQYKEESEKTLYGINPYDDRMKVSAAFPYKDKWFFQEFVDVPERDKERILELVPENERRIYKALWGYGDEGVKPLEYYFDKYYLPGPNWAGWRPDVNLDDMKVKAVQEEGLDLSDFNFWQDDVQNSRTLPDITAQSGNDIHRHNGFKGYRDMEQNIRAVLEGQGLRDVDIQITPNQSDSSTRVHFNYQEDRSDEIDNYMKYNMNSLV